MKSEKNRRVQAETREKTSINTDGEPKRKVGQGGANVRPVQSPEKKKPTYREKTK